MNIKLKQGTKIAFGAMFILLAFIFHLFFPLYEPLTFYFKEFICFLYMFAGVYFLTK